MATRSDIRTSIKTIFNRNPADIDTVLNTLIDTGVELFSNMIASVNDEEIWQRTISSADISGNINNWQLPTYHKGILSATHIDVSGSDDRLTPFKIISPRDSHRAAEIDQDGSYTQPDTFPSGGWRWDYGKGRGSYGRGMSRIEGRPRIAWQIGKNIFVYPRPDSNEENNIIELVINVKPEDLDADGDSNTITNNYPQALIHYVCALAWIYYDAQTKAQSHLQIAAKLLEEFADSDEIQKILQVSYAHMGAR